MPQPALAVEEVQLRRLAPPLPLLLHPPLLLRPPLALQVVLLRCFRHLCLRCCAARVLHFLFHSRCEERF